MESLKNFPRKKSKNGFNADEYGIYVHKPVVSNRAKGEIGIELEVEGRRVLTSPSTRVNDVYWTLHTEGSLRGESAEYVLSAPCVRGDAEALLRGLYGEFKAHGTVLNLSTRCSTHVHINASGMKVHQLASYVILWGILEEVLVNWCGDKRAGNLFCLRFSDCATAADTWADAFKTGNFNFNESLRYLALNAHSINKFGSLEFRSLRGADNPDLVLKWIECLLHLKDLAMTRFNDPRNIATEFSGLGPVEFLKDLLKDTRILEEVFKENDRIGVNISRSLWDGLRRVQPIIFCLPWYDVIEEAGKERIVNPFGSPKKSTTIRGRRPTQIIEDELEDEDPDVEADF